MVEVGAAQQIDVRIGDVSRSAVIIGDHATVQAPDGVEVIRIVEPARAAALPKPRLRKPPIALKPGSGRAPLGRDGECATARRAARGEPVQFCGPDGIGKSALVRQVAREAHEVVFLSARRRSLDDLGPLLFGAFWECDQPFVPAPADVAGYLADREVLIVLDDVELDRDEVELLLDLAPRCTWVLAGVERTLWAPGRAVPLTGLSPAAGAALIRRELGRDLTGSESAAAAAIATALAGHPQRLVEAAAIAGDGHATLEQLARAPETVRGDAYALTDTQLRILAVLAAAAGEAVATEHVAAVAGQSHAADVLAGLERLGWAKSASPRYRLMRRLPPGSPQPPVVELMHHLTRHAAAGVATADDGQAIEGVLAQGVHDGHWDDGVALARAAERPMATAGLLGSWERVLDLGERAALQSNRERDAAFFLHERGSRAMCLRDDDVARDLLTRALEQRERIHDDSGAELTRRNLDQLRGGGGGPWRPGTGLTLAAVAALVAAAIAVLLLTGGGDDTEPSRSSRPGAPEQGSAPAPGNAQPPGGATERPAGPPPAIEIASPTQTEYRADEKIVADYRCSTAAEGVRIVSCEGNVRSGGSIDMTPGDRTFAVDAEDSAGQRTRREVAYSVAEPPPPPPPPEAEESPIP